MTMSETEKTLAIQLSRVLDGARGYITENGQSERYWRNGILEDAQFALDYLEERHNIQITTTGIRNLR